MTVFTETISHNLELLPGTTLEELASCLCVPPPTVESRLEGLGFQTFIDEDIISIDTEDDGYRDTWAEGLRLLKPVLGEEAHIIFYADTYGVVCITPDGVIGGENANELLRRHATLSRLDEEIPRYVHDCRTCTFLGRFQGGQGMAVYDLYHCTSSAIPTVLARFGDHPCQNLSGMIAARSGHHPPLTEALRRWEEREKNVT
jgi:hypothetical protein